MTKDKLIEVLEGLAVGVGLNPPLRKKFIEEVADGLFGAEAVLTESDKSAIRFLEQLQSNGVDNWDGYEEVDWTYIRTGQFEGE